MVAPILKTLGFIAGTAGVAAAGYKAYDKFKSSENNLAQRTNEVAENLVSQLETLTSEGQNSHAKYRSYGNPFLGSDVIIGESNHSRPVFKKKDQGFHFLGSLETLSEDNARDMRDGNYTECRSSVIVPCKPNKDKPSYVEDANYNLVKPLIIGKDQCCLGLHEDILRDQAKLAVQKKLKHVYNVNVFQCQQSDNGYKSCKKVGDLMNLNKEVQRKINADQFTPCHFHSLDEGRPYEYKDRKYHGTNVILLDLPLDGSCEDFRMGEIYFNPYK